MTVFHFIIYLSPFAVVHFDVVLLVNDKEVKPKLCLFILIHRFQ